MKKIKLVFVSALIILVLGCEERVPNYHSFYLDLVITFTDSVPQEYRSGIKIELTNRTKNYSFTEYTDDSARVRFENIEPGFFMVNGGSSYSLDGEAVYLNGSAIIDLFSEITDTLVMTVSKSNAFVIKQYYYSACLTPAGNQYSGDQFVEIHNNTDLVQYADGISLIEHESYGYEPSYFGYLKDSIFVARMIWTIPGNGTDYPVPPGSSIVLARDGVNHQDDSIGNPLSPVDLSMADFEFWVESVSGDDLDGAHAVNLVENLFTYRGTDVVFHTRGGSAIAIALIPGTQEDKQDYIDHHLIAKPDNLSRFYGKIPNEYILDAVEVTWDEAHAGYKRFPDLLDAGYTYVVAGSKSGLCVRRKVQEIIDGRYVYKDTNNSKEDFLKDVVPKPWLNEE